MLNSIVEQIKQADTSFNQVGLIADITALLHGGTSRTKISLKSLPGAFVHLDAESATPASTGTQQFKQMITERYGVITVTRSRNDASGEKSVEDARVLVKELDGALLGFTPEGAIKPLQKSRSAGRLLRWTKDLYFYASYYEAPRRICKTGV